MKYLVRISYYIFGFFNFAVGIVFALKSGLGVSPISSIALTLSTITGVQLGYFSAGVYVVFVLIQILILRRDFKMKNLLQVVFSLLFGVFVGWTEQLFQWVQADSYLTRLVYLAISIFFISFGTILVITMDIVPSASEGLILILAEKLGWPFHKAKIWFDCGSVVFSAILSLLFMGKISAIREGTILSALAVGKVVGILSPHLKPWLLRTAFYDQPNLACKSVPEL